MTTLAEFLASKLGADLAGPSAAPAAIVPHNSTNFANPCRGIYVGVTGNVSLIPLVGDGVTPVVFKNAQAGSVIPAIATRVNATGTTATDLIGMF